MLTTTIKTARQAWKKLSREEREAVQTLFSELCPKRSRKNEALFIVEGIALDEQKEKIRIKWAFYCKSVLDAINIADITLSKYGAFAYRLKKNAETVHCNIKGDIF